MFLSYPIYLLFLFCVCVCVHLGLNPLLLCFYPAHDESGHPRATPACLLTASMVASYLSLHALTGVGAGIEPETFYIMLHMQTSIL